MLFAMIFAALAAHAKLDLETIRHARDLRATRKIVLNVLEDPDAQALALSRKYLGLPEAGWIVPFLGELRALDLVGYYDALETARALSGPDLKHATRRLAAAFYDARVNPAGRVFELRGSLDVFAREFLRALVRAERERHRGWHLMRVLMESGRPFWVAAIVEHVIAPRVTVRIDPWTAGQIDQLLPLVPPYAFDWVERALAEHTLDARKEGEALRKAFATYRRLAGTEGQSCASVLFTPHPRRPVEAI